jgi:spermidine/putrescine transport system permease protein
MIRTSKIIILGLFLAYIYAPIVLLIVNSFNLSRYGNSWKGFTTQWYEKLLKNDSILDAAWHSLTIAVTSATVATIIGTLAAVALLRYRFRGKAAMSSLIFISMLTPDIVIAISLLVIFLGLGIELGFFSLLIAHITFCLPFVIITVYSRMHSIDIAIFEAAKDLGASEGSMFRFVLMPLALPAIAAAWLLSFTLSLDDVIVSAFVTGPGYEILPLKIYSMVRIGVSPEVNAISTLLFAFSLVVVLICYFLMNKGKTK